MGWPKSRPIKHTKNSKPIVAEEKLEMEKIYPDECLKKLFPNYDFYNKRNIKENIQKMYKCGLASAGKMYRRVVFPIYNSNQQICGFTGRKIEEPIFIHGCNLYHHNLWIFI